VQLRLPGLEATRLPPVVAGMPWGLTVTPKERGVVEAFWDPRLYEPAGVRGMLEQLVTLVDRATTHPDLTVAELAPGRWRIPRVRRGWVRRAIPALSWMGRLRERGQPHSRQGA